MQRREVEENGTAIAYFLPETLKITGDVETQMLRRGICRSFSRAGYGLGQVCTAGFWAAQD